jgi:UDP-2,3-diacylglucosamine hydrolase
MLRNEAFIADFLSKPLEVRTAIAAEYRSKSGEAVSMKANDIMDVNQATVEQYLTDFNVKRMIHGHTHRPAKHTLSIQGKDAFRYVLPEWQGDKAGYLTISDSNIELVS